MSGENSAAPVVPTATVSASVNQGFSGFSAVDVSVNDASGLHVGEMAVADQELGVSSATNMASVNVSMALSDNTSQPDFPTDLSSSLVGASQSQTGPALQMAAAYSDAAAGSMVPDMTADMTGTMIHEVSNVHDVVSSITRTLGTPQGIAPEQPNVCKVRS